MKHRNSGKRELIKDVFLISIGILIAIILSNSGIIDSLINFFGDGPATSFIAGIFFTSVFTIAPASVALVHISETVDSASVAIWGALGALCGDLFLFFIIKDKFVTDLTRAFKPSFIKHVFHTIHFGFLKWLTPVVGALFIASPLPNEFGIALMGISETRLIYLVPVSFFMNMFSIYFFLWLAGFL